MADLTDQNIIVKRDKYYEFRFNGPELNQKPFEELRNAKLQEFDAMLNYINTTGCRMTFLCKFLGDMVNNDCGQCDNDT